MRDATTESTRRSVGDWSVIEQQLPSNYEELAEECGLIKKDLPAHMGAKITKVSQILRLIFYHVATNTALRGATATAVAAGLVSISAVALHKWMKKIGPYMAKLLELTTDTKDTFAAERWAGYDIQAVDATTVVRPGACTTTARVHYVIQLTTLKPTQIEVTDETGGETFRRFEAKPGELWMGDRVYANPPGIADIHSSEADVLVRYNRGSLPLYDGKGRRIDIFQKFAKLKKTGRIREWTVWVHPQDEDRIQGRLCVVRLPADKAEEARKRLQKEQGSKTTKESLAAAEFVAVFTTAPRDRLSKERVMELYGLRWQVELHIKRDKSIAGLDKLPNFRKDTIFSWICTKLLLAQISRNIAASDATQSTSEDTSANILISNPGRPFYPTTRNQIGQLLLLSGADQRPPAEEGIAVAENAS